MLRSDPLILPLRNAETAQLHLVGGKAAHLGVLMRARFPVPDGFCITTAAYWQVAELAHISLLLDELKQVPAHDEARHDTLAAALRERIQAAPIPTVLSDAVTGSYRQMGANVPVAVRSSATAEDLPEAAFAGQQDTFLNVVGIDALLEAVRRCWASLWTDRAVSYRERQGVAEQGVAMAVVVQRMVAAEAAGVLYTANPVSGERDETVIDSSPGLGEAVVSGQVTPDHFLLRKTHWPQGWRIVERRAGRREVVIRARSGGGTELGAGSAGSKILPLPDRVTPQ